MQHSGSCHCGRIAFELEADIAEVADCNCSLCRRRGGLLWFGPRESMVLTTPATDMGTYTFNKHHLQHHFCSTCGVAPFSEGEHPQTGAKMVAINVRCLPNVDLTTLTINRYDGAEL